MITPAVNINGTDKQQLLDQMLTVVASLNAVLQNLADARPHGRDYAYMGLSTLGAAHAQHIFWEKRVEQIRSEIEEWVFLVDKGISGD